MDSPRLLGMLCVRNEASRYLQQCLAWHAPYLDEIFVYDDQSTDDTPDLARAAGATVVVRPDSAPSFLQHEGLFRQAAWEAFEIACHPEVGDWVLAFDADEFLTGFPSAIDPRRWLSDIGYQFARNGYLGCRVPIHEVFKYENGTAWARTDGYWGEITGVRFFAYRPGGHFANREMGCGSAPTYVNSVSQVTALELFHLGYARPEDRIDKHNRYFGRPGHNPRHIDSILTTPNLTPWPLRLA